MFVVAPDARLNLEHLNVYHPIRGALALYDVLNSPQANAALGSLGIRMLKLNILQTHSEPIGPWDKQLHRIESVETLEAKNGRRWAWGRNFGTLLCSVFPNVKHLTTSAHSFNCESSCSEVSNSCMRRAQS